MDFPETTKAVYTRIREIDPENVSKIIGYLLLQDHGEQDMIRLAFGPDALIHSFVAKAKADLVLSSKPPLSSPPAPVPDPPLQYAPFSPTSSLSPPLAIRDPCPYSERIEFVLFPEDNSLRNHFQFLSLENQLGSDFSGYYIYPEGGLGMKVPVKACHYFLKGFCKHGSTCRFLHTTTQEGFSAIGNDAGLEERLLLGGGSLERLEMELTELLRSRRGMPISIASLPMLYYETYGKTLQAEGYLTESQRQGKTGYSLTRLLARLQNTICLIDRPHGQHSVIMREDLPKYMDFGGERNEHGEVVTGSRQIYLTFPADSPFTEQDVSNYFTNFGPVQDVRIPCQQRRMFGFVTFVFAETAKMVLAKGNPHFVCRARVLVKPYREKSRLVDRKHVENFQHHPCYGHYLDGESEIHTKSNSRLIQRQLNEEHEQALEYEIKKLSGLELAAKSRGQVLCPPGYLLDESRVSEGFKQKMELTSAEGYSYLLDVLNNGSSSEDVVRRINTKCDDQESSSSQGLNLPDSPFGAPLDTGISAVM